MDITRKLQNLTWDALDVQSQRNQPEARAENAKQNQLATSILSKPAQINSKQALNETALNKESHGASSKLGPHDKIITAAGGPSSSDGLAAAQQLTSRPLKAPHSAAVENLSFREFRKAGSTPSQNGKRGDSDSEVNITANGRKLNHELAANLSRPNKSQREQFEILREKNIDLRRNSFIEDSRQRLRQEPTKASMDESGHPRAAAFQAAQEWTEASQRHALNEVKSHYDRGREPYWKEPRGTEKEKIEQVKANIEMVKFRSTQISYGKDKFGELVQKYRMALPGQPVGPGVKNKGPGVMYSQKRGLVHLMDRERTSEQKAKADKKDAERQARRAARKNTEKLNVAASTKTGESKP